MSEPNVVIDFNMKGAGWADIELRIGEKSYRFSGVSYCTDALGDLLRLALEIATGAWTARTSFDGEPHEWRLIATNLWDSHAWKTSFFVRVLTFRDIYKHQPDAEGNCDFDAECAPEDFVRAALEAGHRVWATHGEKYVWQNYPFPMRALRALETAIATTDPPLPRETKEYIAIGLAPKPE